MIVCTECGNHNENGRKFCASCGSYLEFAGERVEVPTAVLPAPPAETAASPSPPSRLPSPTPLSEPGAGLEPSAPPAPTMATPDRDDSRRVAVQPAKAKARPAPVAPPAELRARQPGDVICPECGEPNSPPRQFCGACATPLFEPVSTRLAWWGRVRQRMTRDKSASPAGTRHWRDHRDRRLTNRAGAAGQRVRRTVSRVGAIAAIAGVGLVAVPIDNPVRDLTGDIYDAVRGKVAPKFEQVRAVDATVTSASAGHPAQALIDDTQAWWAEEGSGACEDQSLTFTFDSSRPFNLDQIGFYAGAAGDSAAQPRPRDVRVVFPDGSTTELRLKDTLEFQRLPVKHPDVTMLVLDLLSSYPIDGASGECSIREVEFYARD